MYVRTQKWSIQDAKALFEFCDINLTINTDSKCQHKKRVFFYQENIKRDEKSNLHTLKGTQSVQNVRCEETGIVKARHLSCLCKVCIGEGEKNVVCSNEKYVGQWKMHHMQGRELQIVKDSNKVKSKGKREGKGIID